MLNRKSSVGMSNNHILSLVLTLVCVTLALPGCGDSAEPAQDNESPAASASSTAAEDQTESQTDEPVAPPVLDGKILIANGWQEPLEVVIASQPARVQVDPIWFVTLPTAAGEQEIEIFKDNVSIFKNKVQASADKVVIINPGLKMQMRYDTHVYAGIQGTDLKEAKEPLTEEVTSRAVELQPDQNVPKAIRLKRGDPARVMHRLAFVTPDTLTDAHVFRAAFGDEIHPVYGLSREKWDDVAKRLPTLEASPYRIQKLKERLDSQDHDKAVEYLVKWDATDTIVQWATSQKKDSDRFMAWQKIVVMKLPDVESKTADVLWNDPSDSIRREVYQQTFATREKQVTQAVLAELEKAAESKEKLPWLKLLNSLPVTIDFEALGTKHVTDRNVQVRNEALNMLQKAGTESALALYIKVSEAGDNDAKVHMLSQLSRTLSRDETVAMARKYLKDDSERVQGTALMVLYKHEPQAVADFIVAKADESLTDKQRDQYFGLVKYGKMTDLYEPVCKALLPGVESSKLRTKMILLLYEAKSDAATPAAKAMFEDEAVSYSDKKNLARSVKFVDPELMQQVDKKYQ